MSEMRLRDVVVKRTLGRVFLHHLRSSYHVELNDRALAALQESLASPDADGPGRAMLRKLEPRGVVVQGACEAIPERNASPLVSVEVEPIGRCNLRCGHCFARFSEAVMSDTTFASVLRGARILGAVELTFNGGEPLLNRRCVDWVELASAQGLRTLLFTNGTLVSARTAQRLKHAGLARVTVSIDGFEVAHDALRGDGAWRRAARGIRHLVAAGLRVIVTTMVHPANEADLEALHRYCRDTLGAAGVRLSTIAPMGRAAARPDLQLGAGRFKAVYQAEPTRGVDAAAGALPCHAGVNKVYVSARGEVHGCHLFDGVAPPLGHLASEPLEAIYAAATRRRCGDLFHAFASHELLGCARCPALADCGGGCRARAWTLTGDRFGVDPISCRKRGIAGQL